MGKPDKLCICVYMCICFVFFFAKAVEYVVLGTHSAAGFMHQKYWFLL